MVCFLHGDRATDPPRSSTSGVSQSRYSKLKKRFCGDLDSIHRCQTDVGFLFSNAAACLLRDTTTVTRFFSANISELSLCIARSSWEKLEQESWVASKTESSFPAEGESDWGDFFSFCMYHAQKEKEDRRGFCEIGSRKGRKD